MQHDLLPSVVVLDDVDEFLLYDFSIAVFELTLGSEGD